MPDDKQPDEIVDEMPDPAGMPCGDIFGVAGEAAASAPDDDDDMPAPEGRCGDQFGGSQTIHVTDAQGDA
jgi:hypothetical protein